MPRRRWGRAGLWALAVGGMTWLGVSTTATVLAPLKTAFAATGARPAGFSLDAWEALPGGRGGPPGLGAVVQTTLARLYHGHPPAGVVPVRRGGAGWASVTATVAAAGLTTRVIAERLSDGRTYLVVDRSLAGGWTGLPESLAVVSRVLAPWGGHVFLNLTLEGRRRAGRSGPEAVARRALAAVGARPVSDLVRPDLVSLAGYTPLIGASDRLHGRRVDLQAAIVPDPGGEWQVYVGTPLITITY
ncbi:MAG: YwmB family TATA-box binding protein [Firmicutes bacterium]|nr:YwmB family TATA-box binding protein [Bacillota bacterium]